MLQIIVHTTDAFNYVVYFKYLNWKKICDNFNKQGLNCAKLCSEHILYSFSLGDALTIAAVRPFFLLLLLIFLKMFRIILPSANCKNHFSVTDSQIDLKPACKSNFEFYIFPN